MGGPGAVETALLGTIDRLFPQDGLIGGERAGGVGTHKPGPVGTT